MLLYLLVPHVLTGDYSKTAQQFLLIVAGVAAGAIFLPELTENLWTLDRDEVRQIVPVDKRASLNKVLLDAETDDDEWTSLVFHDALKPLLASCANPVEYVKDMRYTVQAHLNQSKTFDSKVVRFHGIETRSHSDRVLPPTSIDGSYCISLARTQEALLAEFRNSSCLAREIVSLESETGTPLDGQEWHDSIKTLCKASIAIDGDFVDESDISIEPSTESGTDLVRIKFHLDAPPPEHRVPVFIGVDFPILTTEDRFPVFFSAFYCAGSTVASMRVFGLDPNADLRCDSFFARGLAASVANNEMTVDGLVCKQRTFTTGHNSILWPGSGVLFDWHRCNVIPPTSTAAL